MTDTETPATDIQPVPKDIVDGTTPGRPEYGGLFPRLRGRKGSSLTEADVAALAVKVSDDPIRLEPDDLACADCGRVVTGPHDLADVTYAEPQAITLPGGVISSTTSALTPEPLVTCESCAARHDLSADLTSRYLPNGYAIGGLSHRGDAVTHLVHSSLTALEVLGYPAPAYGPAMSRDVLALALRHLAPLGAALAWRSRFAPVRAEAARSDTAVPRPWAHVRESDRVRLRVAYARLMAERVSLTAPPIRLAPPPIDDRTGPGIDARDGCLMCGVGTVALPALAVARLGGVERAAHRAWSPRRWSPATLGGRPGPVPVVGYICRHCEEAVSCVGAIGPSALERALMVHLGTSSTWHDGDAIDGLTGWAAAVVDAARRDVPPPPPNATPWAHVGGLDALAETLGKG